jgi:hypothetical protein
MNQELKDIISAIEILIADKPSAEIALIMLEVNKVFTLQAEFADIKIRKYKRE